MRGQKKKEGAIAEIPHFKVHVNGIKETVRVKKRGKGKFPKKGEPFEKGKKRRGGGSFAGEKGGK